VRIFYDTEFLEDGQTIALISIGMVAEDGREYYAVNSEVPWDRIKENDWLVRNVLPSLPVSGRKSLDTYLAHSPNSFPRPSIGFVGIDVWDSRVKPHQVIANEVRDFILATPNRQLWAWYGAYDHVALCQLWGRMIDLPDGVPMWTNDLKQEAQRLGNPAVPEQGAGEHNALADARHNRVIAEFLDGIRVKGGTEGSGGE
jgi:3' exoribonuclease, RNase T-like